MNSELFYIVSIFVLINGVFSEPMKAYNDQNARAPGGGCTKLNAAISGAAAAGIIDPIVIPGVTIPINMGAAATGSFVATDGINITDLGNIKYDNCTAGPDFGVWHSMVSDFNVHFNNYVMDVLLVDHLQMDGTGEGNIWIEQFGVTVWGDGEMVDDTFQFTNVQIDLDLYRWTVDFEGILPGTDLGLLFNEFFSMVGPETIDALETLFNQDPLNKVLLNVCNRIIMIGIPGPGEKCIKGFDVILDETIQTMLKEFSSK